MNVSHYQVNLEVKGLVHIGNGKKYDKNDYFIDGQTIYYLNQKEFINQLDRNKLYDDYFDWINSGKVLKDWLAEDKKQRLSIVKSAEAYHFDGIKIKNRNSDIFEFVKTFCDGNSCSCPYVPGSSFKGALRTALLAAIIADNSDNKYADDYRKDRKNKKSAANDAIQRRAFCQDGSGSNDAINDIMRFVSVSDSELLDISDLVLAQKCDRLPKTDEKGGDNKLNVYRECLNAGTKISLQVDLDERINKYLKDNECLSYDLNAEGIARVFRDFDERYEECFLDHFDTSDVFSNNESASETASDYENWCHHMVKVDLGDRVEEIPCKMPPVGHTGYCETHQNEAQQTFGKEVKEHKAICYLGGGVDFDSKTILNVLFSNDKERLGEISRILCSQFPENHHHSQDQKLGVSPHTLKLGIANGQLYLMGKCELKVTQLKD